MRAVTATMSVLSSMTTMPPEPAYIVRSGRPGAGSRPDLAYYDRLDARIGHQRVKLHRDIQPSMSRGGIDDPPGMTALTLRPVLGTAAAHFVDKLAEGDADGHLEHAGLFTRPLMHTMRVPPRARDPSSANLAPPFSRIHGMFHQP